MRFTSRALFCLVLFAAVTGAPSVLSGQTLVWDPNTESTVAGYRVHRGTESGKYTSQVDVGNKTSHQPQGVDWNSRQFFAVQAYTSTGLKSTLSAEVAWTPPSITTVTGLTASVGYPLLTGRPVTWTAAGSNNLGSPVEYRFWMFRRTGWVMVRDYATTNTYTWTPTQADQGEPYYVQVWARVVGSTVQHESWRSTAAFAVTTLPIELSANVDFPTPPANQVTWTVKVANATSVPHEYMFWVWNQNTGVWSPLRAYGPGVQANWTPESVGKYAVRAWARPVGSTADFTLVATSEVFDVSRTAVSLTDLSVDTIFPARTGTTITWTARPKGGMSGPLQYQFWLYTPAQGWAVAQPYGASHTFTWTPTWGDEGDHAVQVWVRSNGSTAEHEGWLGTGTFSILRAGLHLTTTSLFPIAPGSQVNWRADVADQTANLEYQFWVYSGATASWSIGKPYNATKTYTWVPQANGSYAVQAWARQVGSSVPYDVFRGTDVFQIAQGPAQGASLTTDVSLPARVGTTITWTTGARGGTGPLEYQFWRRDSSGWVIVQGYGPSNQYIWTPSASGQHQVQVWIRSAGSSAAYEAYLSTGLFTIQP